MKNETQSEKHQVLAQPEMPTADKNKVAQKDWTKHLSELTIANPERTKQMRECFSKAYELANANDPEALKTLVNIKNTYPEIEYNPDYHWAVGFCLSEVYDSFNEAVAAYTRAIELNSELPILYFDRSRALKLLGDIAGSERDLAKLNELDPTWLE